MAGVENAETNSVLASIEAVSGGDGDDTITGDGGANRLDGRDGDDSIRGADGDDTLLGGRGFNLLDGGAGQDTASYAWATDAVSVSLAGGLGEVLDPAAAPGGDPAARDDLLGIENVVGGAGNDTILGDGGANTLDGAAGNDSVTGGDGDDTLFAGQGRDTLTGGDGFDTADFATVGGRPQSRPRGWGGEGRDGERPGLDRGGERRRWRRHHHRRRRGQPAGRPRRRRHISTAPEGDDTLLGGRGVNCWTAAPGRTLPATHGRRMP